jgi:hypothetical protein
VEDSRDHLVPGVWAVSRVHEEKVMAMSFEMP